MNPVLLFSDVNFSLFLQIFSLLLLFSNFVMPSSVMKLLTLGYSFFVIILVSHGDFEAELSCSSWFFGLFDERYCFYHLFRFNCLLKMIVFFWKLYWFLKMIQIQRWAVTTFIWIFWCVFLNSLHSLTDILRFSCQMCFQFFCDCKIFVFCEHVLHWGGSVFSMKFVMKLCTDSWSFWAF